ncbi:MAG: beta strand repeat-containing protein, partial [Janthinobacterium lividum]
GGAPRFTLDAAASLSIDGAINFFAIQSSGGAASYDVALGGKHVQASLTGGSWTMQGWDGFTSFATAAGPNGVTMHLGDGRVQVISGGADEIWAGSGDTVVQASGAADIHAGTGALAVYGRGQSGANVWGNGGTYLISGDTGGITYHGDDQASTVQADLSNITLLGGAGHLTIEAGSRQTIIGGTGGLTVTENSGGGANSITTLAGTTNAITLNNGTLDSWGNDAITQPGGNNTLSIHGDATIQGSTGNSHISIFGHATLAGRGGDWITLAPGADATVQAGWRLEAGLSQSSLRVTAPGGDPSLVALSMQNGTGSVLVEGGRTAEINTEAVPVGARITVDGGDSRIYSRGADQVRAGAGTALVRTMAGNSEIWGGSGQLTYQNWDGTAGDRQTIHGGTGSVSVSGSNGDITYFGGAGTAVLDGSARKLAIRGGAGSITVANAWATSINFVGGSGGGALNIGNAGGAVTFGTGDTAIQESAWGVISYTATSASRGTQVITGFRIGTDVLHLAGTTVAGQTTDGTGTTLTTTGGARIVLQGITAPAGMIVAMTPLLNPVLAFVNALAPQPFTAAAATVEALVPAAVSATVAPAALAASLPGGTPAVASSDGQAASASQSAGLQATPDPASGAVSMPMTGSTSAPAAPDPVSSQLGSLQAAELTGMPASPAFAVTEAVTGEEAQTDGDAYAGPVALLQRQFIWSGTNGIVVSASTSNVFLHGGAGDDALAVQDGNNVLDGGAGSNFLVGGTGAGGGTDTFFVDGRGGNTWSTIVNFHQGDSLTLWGFQPGTSTQPWTASDGVAGYTGVTLHSELAGAGTGVNASATLAGLTMDDVQRLTMITGTVGGVSFLNVAYTG